MYYGQELSPQVRLKNWQARSLLAAAKIMEHQAEIMNLEMERDQLNQLLKYAEETGVVPSYDQEANIYSMKLGSMAKRDST